MKSAIIVVTYNLPSAVFLLQAKALEKYHEGEYDLRVVDNSSDEDAANSIRYHSSTVGGSYMRTQATSQGGSDSHAFALNVAHQKYKDEYDYFLYLDHDVIPFKEFSVQGILGDNVMAGIIQTKKKLYLWPGCIFIGPEVKQDINFNPDTQQGTDTGGSNWPLVEKYRNRIIEFSEEYRQNDQYSGFYNFYSVINNMFMHFINSSNWAKAENNQDRLNSLINIYKSIEDGN